MITAEIINGIWNYYLSLEKDLDNTSRYIEPKGQENVFSFEFGVSCTRLTRATIEPVMACPSALVSVMSAKGVCLLAS